MKNTFYLILSHCYLIIIVFNQFIFISFVCLLGYLWSETVICFMIDFKTIFPIVLFVQSQILVSSGRKITCSNFVVITWLLLVMLHYLFFNSKLNLEYFYIIQWLFLTFNQTSLKSNLIGQSFTKYDQTKVNTNFLNYHSLCKFIITRFLFVFFFKKIFYFDYFYFFFTIFLIINKLFLFSPVFCLCFKFSHRPTPQIPHMFFYSLISMILILFLIFFFKILLFYNSSFYPNLL